MPRLPYPPLKKFIHFTSLCLIFISIIGLILSPLIFETKNILAVTTSPFVTAVGTKLYLNGQQYQFTGVNAFNLGTYPGFNAGCGSPVNDLDSFFSKLRPNSAVRMWAFQGAVATNTATKKPDWAGLDRVVNAAQKNGMKLILVLGNQDGHCDDGHYKDKAWYLGGYKQAFNDIGNGLTPIPYLDYVKSVVTRYKDVPAIAMWEPINEPAAGECISGTGYQCYAHLQCSDEPAAAAALKSFFDTVGGAIKNIDHNHLISSGTLGNGQCGTVFEDYQFVHTSSGIDVGSFHDYDDVDKAIPGDQWNGLQKRINQMTILNKPLYVGEVGMIAGSSGCMSLTNRRDKMKAKMEGQFGGGVTGFTPWSYTGGTTSGCNYDIGSSDPLLTLLHDYPVSMSTSNPSPSNTPFPVPTIVPDTQPPTAPANLTASELKPTQVTINWSPATDNVGVSRYEVYKDYAYVTATMATTFTSSGLTPGKSYLFYLKTRDNAGNSSGSSTILKVTTPYINPTPTPTPLPTPTPGPDIQPPTTATNLTATAISPTQVALKWNPATDNVGVSRYEIYRDYSYINISYTTTFNNNNLTPGKTYLYYLKTRDTTGNSSSSSVKVTVTTPLN